LGCEPRYGDKNFFSTPVHTSPGAHPEGFLAAEKPGSGIYRSLLRSDEVEKSIANFYFPSVPPWHVMGRPLPLHIWLNNHNIHRAAKNSLHAGGYVSVELNEKNISMEHLKCSKCLPASLIYFLSFFRNARIYCLTNLCFIISIIVRVFDTKFQFFKLR